MNANDSLERRVADHYEHEVPPRAPDWVLRSTLETIDTTPQRRVLIRVPWRFPHMNTFAKVAIAAVVVIAIGAVGLSVLRPSSSSGVGGQPALSPSPSPTPDPSAPPPLGSTFTSTLHGISIDYPTGWKTAPATEPWLPTSDPNFHSTAIDHIYDGILEDHLFLAFASQPLGGKDGETWATDYMTGPQGECGSGTETITVAGATGLLCGDGAHVAFWVADRGYFIRLYTSDDEAWLSTSYDAAWFRSVLDTVQLDPASARDASAAASPSASS